MFYPAPQIDGGGADHIGDDAKKEQAKTDEHLHHNGIPYKTVLEILEHKGNEQQEHPDHDHGEYQHGKQLSPELFDISGL